MQTRVTFLDAYYPLCQSASSLTFFFILQILSLLFNGLFPEVPQVTGFTTPHFMTHILAVHFL